MKHVNHKGLIILIISVCIFAFILWRYLIFSKKDDPDINVDVSSTLETVAIDPDLLLSSNITYTTKAANDNIPASYELNIPYICQYPELPTGCEITSLTEALVYLGYDIDKEDLARSYLPMSYDVKPGCFINYFLGSPWKTNGSGCFAPAIASAANSFLSDTGSDYRAQVISYSAVNALFNEISQGHPVIVWTSYNYEQPSVTYKDIDLGNGQYFSWPQNEHCVALSGYNLDDNTVTLADPAYGIITKSIEEFTYYYQRYYYQAVVIR